MNEPVNGLIAFTGVVLCGFFIVVALHLRLLLKLSWGYRRLMRENEIVKQRLNDWVSGTGRE